MDALFSCFKLCCFIQNIPVNANQILRQFSSDGSSLTKIELQLAAKSLALKSKIKPFSASDIADNKKIPLPAIAELENGKVIVLVKSETVAITDINSAEDVDPSSFGLSNESPQNKAPQQEQRFLIQNPENTQPEIVNASELIALNIKTLIFIQPGLKELLAKKFDIRLFIPVIKKYKKLF
jgi:hypothetical protein